MLMGNYQREQFGYAKGQADLVLRKDGKWFLLVSVDVPDGTLIPATDFIGVDPRRDEHRCHRRRRDFFRRHS